MTLQIVCFKWSAAASSGFVLPKQKSGFRYSSAHVNTLYRMLKRNLHRPFRLNCITDDPRGLDRRIHPIPIWDHFAELGGCYRRLYVFSRDMKDLIGDRFLCIDLDVLIVGDVTPLFSRTESFVYYQMRGANGEGVRLNGGMYMMDAGAREFIWTEFRDNPAECIAGARHIVGSDQAWMQHRLGLDEANWSQKDGIYDFRLDFIEGGRRLPPMGARIVMSPGGANPSDWKWKLRYPWIMYACR